MATRIFFRGGGILIDQIAMPFVAGPLMAASNGDRIDITRFGSPFVFASPLWSDVATADGTMFPDPGTALAYLTGEFAKTIPLGTSVMFATAAQVSIAHGLGFYPNVSVVDSSGDTIIGFIIQHLSTEALTITFGGATSGVAYLS